MAGGIPNELRKDVESYIYYFLSRDGESRIVIFCREFNRVIGGVT